MEIDYLMVKNDLLKVNVSEQILLGISFKLIEIFCFENWKPCSIKKWNVNFNFMWKALKLFEQDNTKICKQKLTYFSLYKRYYIKDERSCDIIAYDCWVWLK